MPDELLGVPGVPLLGELLHARLLLPNIPMLGALPPRVLLRVLPLDVLPLDAPLHVRLLLPNMLLPRVPHRVLLGMVGAQWKTTQRNNLLLLGVPLGVPRGVLPVPSAQRLLGADVPDYSRRLLQSGSAGR